ncbi:MAG: D-alanyl-D-alanine carboxypeptidase/D-alanyl-D-alanine-endopeptidase, partial [Planctomycetes bacterium]|nr:D-alanyl-D-alanine carboxypeptidase/D-alanyl-D-alanine-endopeptidase [Planctomycetota bacterium]
VTEQSQNDVQITGEIPLGHKPVLRVYEVPDPAAHSRILFSESLQRVGVTIHQPSRQPSENENSAASLPEREQVEKLPVVARHTSPPISESARLILKVSHNLQASALPLLVATKHGERTLRDGLKHQHEFLTRAGVDVESVSFGGGAGGSRADCVTPKATVQLLRYMSTRSDFEPYKRALPRLGVDGTLAKNISPESPVRDKVQAKTGTLYWENTLNRTTLLQTKALAGYMTTSKGRSLAFAIFVNNVPLNEEITIRSIGNDLGKICETVYLSE